MKITNPTLLNILTQNGDPINLGGSEISNTSPSEISNAGFDLSTTDIPDIIKVSPIGVYSRTDVSNWKKINHINKKKNIKRNSVYSFFDLKEAINNPNFENIFKRTIKDSKILKGINYFSSNTSKNESILFTFKKYTNLEIIFSLDKEKLEDGIKYKAFNIIINVMPFSMFEYQPIESKTIKWKINSFDIKDVKEKINNGFKLLSKIQENIKEISKHLNAIKSLDSTFKKFIANV